MGVAGCSVFLSYPFCQNIWGLLCFIPINNETCQMEKLTFIVFRLLIRD